MHPAIARHLLPIRHRLDRARPRLTYLPRFPPAPRGDTWRVFWSAALRRFVFAL